MPEEYVTRKVLKEELSKEINELETRLDIKINQVALTIGDNVRSAINKAINEGINESVNQALNQAYIKSDKRIKKFEKEQTDRLIKVLEMYESKTEKHDKVFEAMKKVLESN